MSYGIVPIPLNAAGQGPAPEKDTVRTVYQIWDECFDTVSEHTTYKEACEALNALQKEVQKS